MVTIEHGERKDAVKAELDPGLGEMRARLELPVGSRRQAFSLPDRRKARGFYWRTNEIQPSHPKGGDGFSLLLPSTQG